jgi:uncharacterized protein YkwD
MLKIIILMMVCNVGYAGNLEPSVFDKINSYRSSRGLTNLVLDPVISKIARDHSQQMSDNIIPFGHVNFNKRVTIITSKMHVKGIGENVAWNTATDNSDEIAVVGWLNSKPHLKNIVGNYKTTGIGIVQTQHATYFTQIFVK